MEEPNSDLVRERSTYPIPAYDAPPKPRRKFEWKFQDRFGNRHGRLRYRPTGNAADLNDDVWSDAFGHDVHEAGLFAGEDFAVIATADEEAFMIHRVSPPFAPVEIFRQKEKLDLRGLSADGNFILVQSAKDLNWFRPELLVIDLGGQLHARIHEFAGVRGCRAGAWAPVAGDQRIVFQHEATGFLQPAIWWPFEGGRVEDVPTGLEGEVTAIWDNPGRALILKRCLNGRSDLHRLNLCTREIETLQPLDGTVFRHELDAENRVIGQWSAAHCYVECFRERERFPVEGFKPSVPLKPWRFRRIAGVPCFVVGEPTAEGPVWTIFEGYGNWAYHHADGYNSKVHSFVDHGFQVVMINTRGCNGFGRAWTEATLENLGFMELEDVRSVRAAMVDEGSVDGDRTILTGESWGGYMTLLGMGTQPELWKMGVAGVPVGDFEGVQFEASPVIRAVNLLQFGGSVRTHAAAYRKASPLTYVGGVRAPVLMLGGRYDLLCPPKQNTNFADALRARGGQCELYLYDGAHGAPDREERIRQQMITLEFLARHCRAAEAAMAAAAKNTGVES